MTLHHLSCFSYSLWTFLEDASSISGGGSSSSGGGGSGGVQ